MQKIRTAFVLGAGLGTRLRPLTLSTPKPMLPVRGRPLIARIFDSLLSAGIGRIIVNTHHAAGKYAEYFSGKEYKGADLLFVHEEELLDTGGGVKNILGLLAEEESLLVYNGDILFAGDMAAFLDDFAEHSPAASLILRSQGDVRNVSVKGATVCDMRGMLNEPGDAQKQYCGIFAASPELLRSFARRDGSVFSTVDVFVDFIRTNSGTLRAYVDDESAWTDIGTMDEYLHLK